MTIADGGLRKQIQGHLPKTRGWSWTPIETAATHQGVPDSFWAHRPTRTNGWIEHKATDGWAVGVRPHQIAWFTIHVAAGVNCKFFVRAKGKGSSANSGDSLWVIDGYFVNELAADGLQGLPADAILGRWYGPPFRWDSEALTRILTGK